MSAFVEAVHQEMLPAECRDALGFMVAPANELPAGFEVGVHGESNCDRCGRAVDRLVEDGSASVDASETAAECVDGHGIGAEVGQCDFDFDRRCRDAAIEVGVAECDVPAVGQRDRDGINNRRLADVPLPNEAVEARAWAPRQFADTAEVPNVELVDAHCEIVASKVLAPGDLSWVFSRRLR